MPFMIYRQGTVVTVASNTGIVLRSFDAFSVPRAVSLEEKLRADKPFADEWARQLEAKPPPNGTNER